MKKLYFFILAWCLLAMPAWVSIQAASETVGGVTVTDYQRYPNPVGTTNVSVIIGTIIKGLMSVMGTAAVVMVVYGGFLWLTSMGNDSKVQRGKDILTWTTIGIAIIFVSYIVVKYVWELVGATMK